MRWLQVVHLHSPRKRWIDVYKRTKASCASSAAAFVPAVLVGDASPSYGACSAAADDRVVSGSRMEVVCLGGRRIVLGPDFDASALVRLLAVVEGR